MYKSGEGQFQIGFGRKGESIVHLSYAVTLFTIERDIPKVIVFLVMPYPDKRQAGIQPILYLKRH